MIDPGELDQQIVIQQKTQTRRTDGGFDVSWTQIAKVWARVRQMRGNERYVADQLEARGLYRFTIRRRTDITAEMRIVWGGKNFNIRFDPTTSGRDHFMTIEAERDAAT